MKEPSAVGDGQEAHSEEFLRNLRDTKHQANTVEMNPWLHQFADKAKEAEYQEYIFDESLRRARWFLVPFLVYACLQLSRASTRGAQAKELSAAGVAIFGMVFALVTIHWRGFNHRLDVHATVAAASTVSAVSGFLVVFFSSGSVEDACDGNTDCLFDVIAGRSVAIGMLVCVFSMYGALALRVFWHFVVFVTTVDGTFVLLFMVLRWDVGNAILLCVAGISIMTLAMVVLNRAIDQFFRSEFLWYSQTVELATEHVAVLKHSREHKQRIVGYLFHEVRNPINNIVLASAETISMLDLLTGFGGQPTSRFAPSARALTARQSSNGAGAGGDGNNNNNGLLGGGDGSRGGEDAGSLADLREMVLIISQAADTATHVLDDALSLEKLEAGNFEFAKHPFAFEELYEPTVNTLSPGLAIKSLKLEVDIEPLCSSIRVVGDVKRLRQVLHNFLSNAIKFTPAEGTVKLQVKLLNKTDESALVWMGVSDTGIGVPESEQQRLFLPWSQVRAAETQGGGGTGLGLSLSKDFVQRGHAGTIGMRSPGDLGCGSTFFFEIEFPLADDVLPHFLRGRLPSVHDIMKELGARPSSRGHTNKSDDNDQGDGMGSREGSNGAGSEQPPQTVRQEAVASPPEAVVAPEPAPNEEAVSQIDVLVVDDSKITCKLVSRMLTSLGVSHRTCENGMLAVEAVKSTTFKLVLMDKEMPVMDGHQATEAIRAFNPDIPIVGVTGNAMDSQQAEFRAHGANDVLAKPINSSIVKGVLKKYAVL